MRHRAVALLTSTGVLAAGPAFAEPDDGATSARSGCRYSVAYTAPPSCPSSATLQSRLGSDFQLVDGTMATCKHCVRGIVIRQREGETTAYEMTLAGLESTTVRRQACEELVDLAAYAVDASDLPEPACDPLPVRLGVSGSSLVNIANAEPLWLGELRASVLVGEWQVTPFGLWVMPTSVQNQMAQSRYADLNLTGYGAGLDVCWSAWRSGSSANNQRMLQVCGLGSWRRLEVTPPNGDFVSLQPADLWTAGLGMAFSWQVAGAFRLEAAPAVSTALVPAETSFDTSGDRIYYQAGVEATLRVGFSWGFGSSDTPNNTEALRSAGALLPGEPTAGTPKMGARRL